MRKIISVFIFLLPAHLFCFSQSGPVQVKFISITVETDSILKWQAVEIKEPFIYIVQQFRWNRWVDWDTLKSTFGKDTVVSTVNISKYIYGGINKFRLRAVNEKMLSYSKPVSMTSPRKAPQNVSGHYNKKMRIIDFGRKECFEIYDKNGKLMMKGYSQTIDVGDLPKDLYYLNYDNISSEFIIS